VALCGLLACGSDERPKGPTTTVGLTGGSDTDDTGIDVDDEDKLDLGGGSASAGNGDDGGGIYGCTKVDLLFVIDNSGSMEDEQANLISSFPGFIDGMRQELADTQGYHVGITTSDLYASDFTCLQEGALITQTAGDGASNRNCGPYVSGKRFMTEADDLTSAFSCAARVGISGDGNERPMQTMLAALSSGMNAPGACNDGFIRDDALLVVVIITDEEDDHETMGCTTGMTNAEPQPGSLGDPNLWYDQIVDIKGGKEQNIVVLSLVGPSEGQACPPLAKCDGGIDGAEVASRIIDFTTRFTYGFVGPVCEPYGPFFVEAISQIKSACDNFDPVG
jgi:hypothetical protein